MITDLLLFTTIVTTDRITKAIVPHVLVLHQSIPVIPSFFHITYVSNTGGAFGILVGWDSPVKRAFFILASLIALVLIVYLYRQAVGPSYRAIRVALTAIGAGAVGNLYDRITTGEVVDFLDFFIGSHHWPAFNVADSAISVGATVLLFLYVTGRTEHTDDRRD